MVYGQEINILREFVDVTRWNFLNFSVAWKIQKSYGTELEHHPRCSSVKGWDPINGSAFLCDCGAIETEFERLCKEQVSNVYI
jgi:hypothetical protein